MHPAFEVHKLNEEGLTKARELANSFDQLLTFIESTCHDTTGAKSGAREMALVRTKLEEASFFAKKAMAVQERYQIKGD